MLTKKQTGFSLIELLVVIAIVGILSSIILGPLGSARERARDAKRKAEISSIGRVVTQACYLPDAGEGVYDIADLIPELVSKYPQYANYASRIPMDPSASGAESLYMYTVNVSGKCAVYANLENEDEAITLQSLTSPTPGGGTGVLESGADGWNNSPKYFQVSN